MIDLLGPASAPGAVTSRPGDIRSFGSADTFFKDCSSPTLDDGTEFQASWFNQVLAVLRSLARGNGQTAGGVDVVTQDNTDDNLLLKAMQHLLQRGQPAFAVDTGSVNALVAALSPAPPELKRGMRAYILAAASNTGATVLNLNGFGNKPVVRRDGTQLYDSDIPAASILEYVFDGNVWQVPSASGRPTLARNLDIYVNGAIGNDANDGVSNVAGHALATIQGAINLAFKYPPSQFTVTIHIADGTYAAAGTPSLSGPNLSIIGNVTTPTNVVINGGNTMNALSVSGPNNMDVQGVTVQTGSAAPLNTLSGFVAGGGASMNVHNTASNSVQGGIFEALAGASLNVAGPHTFLGNSQSLFWGSDAGTVILQPGAIYTIGAAITLINGVAFTNNGGIVTAPVARATFANPGNVTGPKFLAASNGIIDTQGAGVSYFPGSTAGSYATGGQYV